MKLILIALNILFISVIVIQSYYIDALEKQIMSLNKELVHLKTCHEIMESVKHFDRIEKESQYRERENDNFNFK